MPSQTCLTSQIWQMYNRTQYFDKINLSRCTLLAAFDTKGACLTVSIAYGFIKLENGVLFSAAGSKVFGGEQPPAESAALLHHHPHPARAPTAGGEAEVRTSSPSCRPENRRGGYVQADYKCYQGTDCRTLRDATAFRSSHCLLNDLSDLPVST